MMAVFILCKAQMFGTLSNCVKATFYCNTSNMLRFGCDVLYRSQLHTLKKAQTYKFYSTIKYVPLHMSLSSSGRWTYNYLKECAKSYSRCLVLRQRWIPSWSSLRTCNFNVSFIRRVCWVPGLTVLDKWRNRNKTPSHAQEALLQIPKEVLRPDKPKKRKSSLIARILGQIWEALHYIFRFVRIVITFTPLLATYPLICWNDSLKRTYWRVLLYTLESTGATFIKLGQWAGTRRDLFSKEFCDLFSCLHVCTRPHPWYITKKKLRKAFGKRWREILVKVHKRPIGSGCIAQVHKAYMKADLIPDESLVEEILEEESDEPEIDFAEGLEIIGLGGIPDELEEMAEEIEAKRRENYQTEKPADGGNDAKSTEISQASSKESADCEDEAQLVPVAVKVLHPGVYRAVQRDLNILSRLVWLTEKIFPSTKWLSLRECMEEFSEILTRQIDLRMEAECLETFIENFQEHPNIRFPKPVWPYCKRSVMVETFEEGEPLSKFLVDNSDNEDMGSLKEKLAAFGVDALLQMIFVDNFVHGDLHPGNILVQNAKDFVPQDENKLMLVDVGDTVIVNVKPSECPVRLVMLDVGITSSLSQEDMENFKAVFTAVVIGEGTKVAELMLNHARYNECKDVEGFKEELGKIVMEARQNTINLGSIQVGKLLSDVFHTLSKHKVKMESNFASILLAIFVLEGLGRSLDPEMDLLERAKPVLLG